MGKPNLIKSILIKSNLKGCGTAPGHLVVHIKVPKRLLKFWRFSALLPNSGEKQKFGRCLGIWASGKMWVNDAVCLQTCNLGQIIGPVLLYFLKLLVGKRKYWSPETIVLVPLWTNSQVSLLFRLESFPYHLPFIPSYSHDLYDFIEIGLLSRLPK